MRYTNATAPADQAEGSRLEELGLIIIARMIVRVFDVMSGGDENVQLGLLVDKVPQATAEGEIHRSVSLRHHDLPLGVQVPEAAVVPLLVVTNDLEQLVEHVYVPGCVVPGELLKRPVVGEPREAAKACREGRTWGEGGEGR